MDRDKPYLLILGIAQDGGFPQAGCTAECCKDAWHDKKLQRYVSCIGIVDLPSSQGWMFDATPDFKEQLKAFQESAGFEGKGFLSGIFISHAHTGHYTGLMNLGREVMGAGSVPVYAMPRMSEFLKTNAPWNQLVKLNNITVSLLEEGKPVTLGSSITVTPVIVPHREEYSETAGFFITGPNRKLVYIPDIDRWEKWSRKLEDVLKEVDIALIDGTFYSDGEVPGRNLSEVPHPCISETMEMLGGLPESEKKKVWFIHLNHTNPAIKKDSTARKTILDKGFNVADELQRIVL